MNHSANPCLRCGKERKEYWHDYQWHIRCVCGFVSCIDVDNATRQNDQVVFNLVGRNIRHKFSFNNVKGLFVRWHIQENITSVFDNNGTHCSLKELIPFNVSVNDIEKYLLLQ